MPTTLHHEVLEHQQLKWLQISSPVYMWDQHLNEWVTSSVLNLAEMVSNYIGLLGDDSFCTYVTGKSDAVKRMRYHESPEIEQTAAVWIRVRESLWLRYVRSKPQYDGASFLFGGAEARMCFNTVCCVVICWWWGTIYICLGITHIRVVPTWFPIITTGPKYQHKISFISKILFENHHLNLWENMHF